MRIFIITLALGWATLASAVEVARPGWGAVLGWPFGVRYQRVLSWKQAAFYDLGYQTDKFVMMDANFSQYFLSEADRWKIGEKTGHVLYSAFVGATAGYHIGETNNERTRLGVRVGGAFEYLWPKTDWTLRAEAAPVLFIAGTTAAGLQGGIVIMKSFGKKKRSHSKPRRPSQKGISAD